MSRRIAVIVAALMMAAGAPTAAAAAPVVIANNGALANVGQSDVALYVDSSGAAHVAYPISDGSEAGTEVALCTIPAGGSSCAGTTTLSVGAKGEYNIQSMKFLPNPTGASPVAYLALGLENLSTSANAEEVIGLGDTAGQLTGPVYVGFGVSGLSTGGVVLEPDASGIDVAGSDGADGPISYQFESFQPGGSGAVATLGTPDQGGLGCTLCVLDVTRLPLGQTAVLASPSSDSSDISSTAPDEMFVQPAAGGSFSSAQQLGITGPAEAASTTGGSYVLNVETRSYAGLFGLPDYVGVAPMELYRFHGSTLDPEASIGNDYGDDNGGANWQTIAPMFEDSAGDLDFSWLTQSADGCPATPLSGGNESPPTCIMYRRVGEGGLLGPKLVLDSVLGSDDWQPSATGPIGADADGAGWMLETLLGPDDSSGISQLRLEAIALPSSATAGSAVVRADTVRSRVSCVGRRQSACVVSGTLGSFGRGSLRIAGGTSGTLVVRLNRAGRRRLARGRHVVLALRITQRDAGTRPAQVLSGRVDF